MYYGVVERMGVGGVELKSSTHKADPMQIFDNDNDKMMK